MPGLEDLYREIILDHYRTPRNRGELPSPPAQMAQGHNPLCGDEISVYLQLDDGVVSDIKVGGQGCSISQSSASMMSQAIKGKAVDEVRALVRRFKGMMSIDSDDTDGDGDSGTTESVPLGDLEALQGVVKFPVRIKCATLAWYTLLEALDHPRGMTEGVLSQEQEARNRAGRALRRVGHAFVGHEAPPEVIDELAATLDRFTARFDDGAPRHRDPDSFEHRERPDVADGDRMYTFDDRPFSGRSSPWGLDLEVHRRGDEIEARVTLGSAHEAAPARSHGGIVAGLFDDVFGFVLDILQTPGFTGELKIRYTAPTPLHRRLACRGRLRERLGRKIWIDGELVDLEAEGGERVVARAEGLFIAVELDAMRAGLSARLPAPPDEA